MRKINLCPKHLSIFFLICACLTISIGYTGLTGQPAVAHDAAPSAPPRVPACLPAAVTCELPEASLLAASIRPFALNGAAALDTVVRHPPFIDGIILDELTTLQNIPCVNGFATIYPCNKVDLLAFIPQNQLGGFGGNDIWGWTDPQTGKEYAVVGQRNGTAFVDISKPSNPLVLGFLPTHAEASAWRGLKVYQNYAFIVADKNEGHGIQVFDLTQLRTVVSPPVTFAETAHYAGFSDAHNIAINEASGYAYTTGGETCGGGLQMVNIQNPTVPQDAGCYTEDGYIHDTNCVIYQGPDADYQGREICFNSSLVLISIVDVTDKSAPRRIAHTTPEGTVYIHQTWLTEDQRYLLMNDEFDETFNRHDTRTYMIDVSDLDQPTPMGVYSSTLPSIDHNLFISGTYAYEANYTTGLRVLDLQDIASANLQEAAWFDTYPSNDEPVFSGAWGSYPFFASGVVIVNTIDRGLFILKPKLTPDFLLESTPITFALCSTNSQTDATFSTPITITARNGYSATAVLQTSGLPSGAQVTFSPSTTTFLATNQQTVTLTVNTQTAPAGDYPFKVEGTDSTDPTFVIDQTPLRLSLAATPPDAPVQRTPAPDSIGNAIRPTFTWTVTIPAVAYTIDIATDSAFANLVQTATVEATSYTPTAALIANTRYFWRVRASNACGAGDYASASSFDTNHLIYLPTLLQNR